MDGLPGFRERQIVDEAEPISLPDRAYLVLAIGVECGEVDVEQAISDLAKSIIRSCPSCRITISPPSYDEGSTTTSVATIRSSFSPSRWGRKKLPGS